MKRLFLLLAGLVLYGMASGDLSPVDAMMNQATYSNHSGPPCPDPNDNGEPCGPVCPCACCPGHFKVMAFISERPLIRVSVYQTNFALAPVDLHPRDLPFCIFHPPRA